jgi:hypothetical protein
MRAAEHVDFYFKVVDRTSDSESCVGRSQLRDNLPSQTGQEFALVHLASPV